MIHPVNLDTYVFIFFCLYTLLTLLAAIQVIGVR